MFDRVARQQEESPHVRFVEWNTVEELRSRIIEILVEELRLPDGMKALSGPDDIAGFDATALGGEAWNDLRFFNPRRGDRPGAAAAAESWQILSPIRSAAGGVPDLNRLIHKRFRKAMLEASRKQGWQRKFPRPMGAEEIVSWR
ncbi:MAG: hypothetical protein U5L08_07810 [Xanthomonadales bacterium]|nr:hypothetical protein [Xanthomonadales bacterium]